MFWLERREQAHDREHGLREHQLRVNGENTFYLTGFLSGLDVSLRDPAQGRYRKAVFLSVRYFPNPFQFALLVR